MCDAPRTPPATLQRFANIQIEKAHIAYACIGIFSTLFSLGSLFVKERLYIGEATVASIAGLILGPHCLNWFDPLLWGNLDHITLELCRIVLCIQIVAVAVELPRKYMKKHWLSVFILLLPVMTVGWLVVGLFIWVLIPHFDLPSALLVSACVTATDPVLAAAVVGKGKFAERVPGHLRNLLTAESGCNDGMAFPFIFLSLNIIIFHGQPGEIIKNWVTLTILWECACGVILGVILGYSLRKAVSFAEKKTLIDRESFLALFVFLAFNSAGLGSMLGVDDLLTSFAAGTAFGWNGDFAKKTEESHVSTVIDLLLNLSFFVYFGAIIPWGDFNNVELGLNVWRLIVLAIVIIFLRRIPAVLALKPITPDIKTWREAFFCGHFGPIGVGAIFAVILARGDLEAHYTTEETPLAELPNESFPHYQLLASMWPIVCFVVITSIIVHGSSVAVLTLGKRLNRMAITMSFTVTNTQDQGGSSWMARLQKLDKASSSFSLQRIDTVAPSDPEKEQLPQSNTIETSGIKVRPAGGARRKRQKKKSRLQQTLTSELGSSPTMERQRPQAEFLQLGRTSSRAPPKEDSEDSPGSTTAAGSEESKADQLDQELIDEIKQHYEEKEENKLEGRVPANIYQEGHKVIVEDQDGEVIETASFRDFKKPQPVAPAEEALLPRRSPLNVSIHSMDSLRRHMSQYSVVSNESGSVKSDDRESLTSKLSKTVSRGKKTIVKKGEKSKRYYAHQVDNTIVIENEDGEIVRRYRVNKHTEPAKRARSGSIMGKALSMVGLKHKEDADAEPAEGRSSQDAENVVVPVLKERRGSAGKVSKKLTGMLNSTAAAKATTPPARPRSPPMRSPSTVYEDLDLIASSGDDHNNYEDVESAPEETEVEKRRRLAALGHIQDGRDLSDEED